MRARPYFESERSARFSVGVGCPSFGGQRTVGSGSIRLHATLVTDLKRSMPAKQGRPGTTSKSQIEASSRVAVLGEDFRMVMAVAALGRPMGENCIPELAQPAAQMLEVSTPERQFQVAEIQALSAVAVSRSGHLLTQPGWPNPSVKGTSRKRAAPYVER
jgi:hypothetical protein